jgi:hypothetical protein
MRTTLEKISATRFAFKQVKVNKNADCFQFIMKNRDGKKVPIIDYDSKMLKGKYANLVKISIKSFDYTTEHIRRKNRWKLGNRQGHISKLKPIAPNIYKADFLETNDAVFIKWYQQELFIMVIPNARHDRSLEDDVVDGIIAF